MVNQKYEFKLIQMFKLKLSVGQMSPHVLVGPMGVANCPDTIFNRTGMSRITCFKCCVRCIVVNTRVFHHLKYKIIWVHTVDGQHYFLVRFNLKHDLNTTRHQRIDRRGSEHPVPMYDFKGITAVLRPMSTEPIWPPPSFQIMGVVGQSQPSFGYEGPNQCLLASLQKAYVY